MSNSATQKRRRGHSIEVVDAKVAVDLATAQTYSENVFLFVPNLIGYARVLLAGLSLHFMTYHPKYCTLAYGISCLLDAVDGMAARALDQTSKFGAVLDMVTDRFVEQTDNHPQRTLFFVCAGNELFYMSLYLMKWATEPIGLPSGLPYGLSYLTYAQALAAVTFPICFLKNVINLVQLWKASKILVGVDLAEREMARKEKDERGRPVAILPSRRRLSTTPTEPASEDPPTPTANDLPDSLVDAPEKPKLRRTRVSLPNNRDSEPVQLPDGLDILWAPVADQEPAQASALPPPENFEDALNKLLITLHPQTQHRAIYSSPLGAPTEPTLALYCPIEGGDYIIDATVAELARRTGAEVLVLDAVQLAAGECGHFGPAANSLTLPRNPLHFPSSPASSHASSSRAAVAEEDDDDGPITFSQPKISLALMAPQAMQGRALISSPRRASTPPSKVKVFFDTLVNTPSKADASDISSKNRPRLVYIRDFPTLAPSSSSWYPPLLSAVRERRRGPISRPSSPVNNPMTIIFGMTPSLTPPLPPNSPSNGLVSLLMNRNSSATQFSTESKSGKVDWGEDDAAEKAREKRLRDRLKKWETSDAALAEDFPKLSTTEEGEENDRPEIIVIGANGFPSIGASSPSATNGQTNSSFFRSCILIPKIRSTTDERAGRMSRRREINELTLRMGVSAAGGIMEQESATSIHLNPTEDTFDVNAPTAAPQANRNQMWEDWGNKVEVWSNVRRIADRAIGNTIASTSLSAASEKPTLEPTVVPWSAVHNAWAAHRSSKDMRASWLKEAFSVHKTTWEQEQADEGTHTEKQEQFDEVIESVRNDPDLDTHEQRLLGCIVDTASMPTSFDQVHLPPHTIDSVRTIVSLPLLHPKAFQQGILKQHGMTGCLLFGPPGTGKTLVVRALAKEAGCRMLTISPSDVMDMYVGEGEKLVKAVFSLARRLSPCVVFLDEIDALFGARMSSRESGGAFAHRGVITEFMQEMDGLKSSKEDSVIVIGATNRPFDLDDAVLRRLPRRLLVDLPGEKEREEIMKILLRDEALGNDLDISTLAKKTESFSGSDLKRKSLYCLYILLLLILSLLDLCVAAALDAVKENVQLPWSTVSVSSGSSKTWPSFEKASALLASVDAPATDIIVEPNTTIGSEPHSVLSSEPSTLATPATEIHTRVLHVHNFTKALKEITPSSSESLGSLAELRKWNDEFGEGRRDKKRQQFWGKGRFGFTDKSGKDKQGENGRVVHSYNVNPSIVGDNSTIG
ncbi:hypothetical protein H0H81_008843 [Sphagnurus paluster]|uniref:AAA+ ATPase domain-containing protein n=1 Tax=Sphagnurus paluster TaxID=117069 RepID=A0A9P7GRC4_9AGAR|nr:hypothetical protein H0H81_008843 [Sphagnurus paluster]